MAHCSICDEEYSSKRKALGYRTCLECGEKQAQRESTRRKRCIAPAYNKGAYMYGTSKKMARDLGR